MTGHHAPHADPPGTLLHSEAIETSLTGAAASRVRYASHDVNGRPTESTGIVIAPTAAASDRPILTWCHGTTGLGDAACPSRQPDPAGPLRTYFAPGATRQIDYGVPGVQGFVDDGWVVCATDYQGLGTPGMHHYEVGRSNARDAVSLALAVRTMDVGAGTTLACAGWSQGAAAAAAVAELDDADFGDLVLVGVVPISPGVASLALKSPTGMGTALAGGDVAPDAHLVMTLAGMAAAHPELDLADVLTPLGRHVLDKSWEHQPVHHLNDTIARMYRLEGPILALNHDRFPAWIDAIARSSAGARAPRCPLFVCIDTFDGGTVVPAEWQHGYVTAVRALGADVVTKEFPHDDHFSLPDSCIDDARTWLHGLLPT
jgi:hypothetical protein